MMNNKLLIITLVIASFCLLPSCNEEDDPTPGTQATGNPNNPGANGNGSGNNSTDEWLIPSNEIFDGGPGKDGIPSIDNPQFVSAADGDAYLLPTDLVIGFLEDGVARAYPHRILDWHEIVNDQVNTTSIAVTYCPLTGTASGWNRSTTENPNPTTFGVSGLLYNTNLIPYDRRSDSHWSQMRLQCVQGLRQGELADLHMIVESTWKTWKELYPDTEVLSTNTGFSRNYNVYPYGDYRSNNNRILFPVSFLDSRRPAKERVLAVIDDAGENALAITFDGLGSELALIQRNWDGKALIATGNRARNFIVSFYTDELPDSDSLTFETASLADLPVVFKDSEGNEWDIFGYAISGPREGQRLTPTRSYMGFYFAVGTFFTVLIQE